MRGAVEKKRAAPAPWKPRRAAPRLEVNDFPTFAAIARNVFRAGRASNSRARKPRFPDPAGLPDGKRLQTPGASFRSREPPLPRVSPPAPRRFHHALPLPCLPYPSDAGPLPDRAAPDPGASRRRHAAGLSSRQAASSARSFPVRPGGGPSPRGAVSRLTKQLFICLMPRRGGPFPGGRLRSCLLLFLSHTDVAPVPMQGGGWRRGAALLDRKGFLNILSTDDNKIIPRLWVRALRAGRPASCSRLRGTPSRPERAWGEKGERKASAGPARRLGSRGKEPALFKGGCPERAGRLRAVGGLPSLLLRRERTYACTPRGNPSSGF